MKIRRKTAFVFQNYNLFRNKTALQNVTEGLVIARKMPRSQAEKAGKRALDKVGLWDRYDYYPHQLSGGQQQRVGIARALVVNPRIIFADEPTGNLDSKTTMEVMRLMQKIVREQQQTLVMVTHDNNLASYADRQIRIIDGKVVEIIENEPQDQAVQEE